jgi:hypothetical protein
MNISGVSTIETSVTFERRQWSGLNARKYRMSQGDATKPAGYAREAPLIGPRGTGAAQR